MQYLLILCLSLTALANSLPEGLEQDWVKLNKDNKLQIAKQSLCFQNPQGIFSKNLQLKVRPASVSKLYTTMWALESLGKDFKFKTQFYMDSSKETLYIKGGSDPFFVSENLLIMMATLKKNQLKRVVFDKNFFLNWSNKPKKIKQSLKNILNSELWSKSFLRMIEDVESYIIDNDLDYKTPSFFASSTIEFMPSIKLPADVSRIEHHSSKLSMHLKQMNVYSTNFYADQVFAYLGGSQKFHSYLYKKFSINSKDTFFYTGSGLGENYTTCQTALKVLGQLKSFSNSKDIKLEEFVSVAGVDTGTLKSRFKKDLSYKVLAKTGTLRHTSTLAGFLGNNKTHLFAIFNHSWEQGKIGAKKVQEGILNFYSKNQSDIEQIKYTPIDYLSILDTQIKKASF